MPITLPNLDDRTFSDLLSQVRSLIPRYAPRWTNHNPSDPGMTLLELFAWLIEMVLYRLNWINDRSYLTFLELFGVGPSSPEAEIFFQISVPRDGLPKDFKIDKGTQVTAVSELSGDEIIFEILNDLYREDGRWVDDGDASFWSFRTMAVNIVIIENEILGASDGSENQEFSFAQRPIFLDKWEELKKERNPQIEVIDKEGNRTNWIYRIDLLESGADENSYTVEHLAGLVRFGDGINGKIPPEGAKIICTYRKVGGPEGNVGSGMINQLKDPQKIKGVDPSKISVTNKYPASGGKESESLEDLLVKGLDLVRERYRAISDEDFEYLAKQGASGNAARVKVVCGRNLENTTPTGEAHVSLIVLPSCEYLGVAASPIDRTTGNTELTHSLAKMEELMDSAKVRILMQDIHRYLDDRRLITTLVHVVKPVFTPVKLKAGVVPKQGVDSNALKEKIEESLVIFLDPYSGWEDGNGWPFGRYVYRSEIYQQIEWIEGVDYVKSLLIDEDPEKSFIPVNENDLVCLTEIEIDIETEA